MADPKITLYRDNNFDGRSVTLTGSGSADLGVDYNFNDETSSIRVESGIWLVYDDSNYSGSCYVLRPGEYKSPDQWKGNNDALSSVRPLVGNAGDPLIMLFQDENYGGRMVPLNQSLQDFRAIDFNDRVSSAIVQGGTWYLYADTDFSGTTWPVGTRSGPDQNGYVPRPGGSFNNDAISSAKLG